MIGIGVYFNEPMRIKENGARKIVACIIWQYY